MSAIDADTEMLHNNVQLIKLKDVVGHAAIEGALPYPPGISVLSLVKNGPRQLKSIS